LPPSFFDALPLHIGCPALFLHFPSIPLLSISGCGRFVLFSPVFFIYRALRSFLDFSSYFPRRLLLPSLFDALPLHIGCLALFLHFLSIPLPSVPRCGCSVFFSSFFFIFRILLSFSVFSSYFPHRLLLPSLFDALPLHIGCPALFLHFPSIPLPSISGCGCSVFFSSFFFIFRILRSFPAFSSHFSRRSFLRFFLVPGRK